MGNRACLTSDTCRGAYHMCPVGSMCQRLIRPPSFGSDHHVPAQQPSQETKPCRPRPSSTADSPSSIPDVSKAQSGWSFSSQGALPSSQQQSRKSIHPARQTRYRQLRYRLQSNAQRDQTDSCNQTNRCVLGHVCPSGPPLMSYPEQTWRTRMTIYWRSSRKLPAWLNAIPNMSPDTTAPLSWPTSCG